MNKLMLLLVSLAAPLWHRAGADPHAIHLILKAKLLMQDRAGFVMGKQQRKRKGMEYLTYFFLFLFSVFFAVIIVQMEHAPTAVGLVFSFQMLYLGLLLITEMSENFFDQRDLYVLLSRPITDSTFSLARLLHVGVFMAKFNIVLGLIPFVTVIVYYGGWAGCAFFLVSISMIALTMTGTMVCYLILLQRVPTERVKKIIGYFQIVASLVFFTAYQLPSMVSDTQTLTGLAVVGEPLGFVFPGLWLGALWQLLTAPSALGTGGLLLVVQALLGLGTALFGGWYYVKQSQGYTDRLLSLKLDSGQEGTANEGADAGAVEDIEQRSGTSGQPLRDYYARLLTHPGMERTSFRFHWNMMLRDITFKQRVYPGLIYIPVILAITIGRDVLTEGRDLSSSSWLVLAILYFLVIVVTTPLSQVKVSEQYQAAWIFSAAPALNRSRLNYGQFLAVVCMFYVPVALVCYAGILLYWGGGFWLDILFGAGAVLLVSLLFSFIDGDHPFSRSKDDNKFANFGSLLLIFVVAPIIGAAQWFLRELPYVLPVFTVGIWLLFLGLLWNMRRPDVRQLVP